ncbi:MAG: ABC transporter ATP-binding protein, partial [Streptomycetaceae bacterium]|nr:ABC transporter ATP-binding protein [Streptomycetaceae bacterium]
CDEPVSALDLSTQARVLDLFIDIQRRTGVAYLFITHDLAVVRYISHRVNVLYRGEDIETGTAETVTSAPEHPYTRKLLLASPVADPVEQQKRRAERRRLAAVAPGEPDPARP